MRAKQALRILMKDKLNSQTKLERRKKSGIIQKKIISRKEFLNSRCVMLYVSKGTNEVETGPLIKKAFQIDKDVVLPVTMAREKKIVPVYFRGMNNKLKRSPYGIYEPEIAGKKDIAEIEDIDLVIVPGLAFDEDNNRLGRGQGYYDRFLRFFPEDTPKIGVCFDFQLLKKIPSTESDFSLTLVITN